MYPFSGTIPNRRYRRPSEEFKRPIISLTKLVALACQVNHVEIDIVRAQGRKRILPVAWTVEHVSLLAAGYSQSQVARALSRDRSAISAARKRAVFNLSKDCAYAQRVEQIKLSLTSPG